MPQSRPGPVVALGGFDGVHLGHQTIIRRAVELASASGAVPAVLTFDPLPAQIVYPDFTFVLTTPAEKRRLLAELGIELIHVVKFDDRIRRTPAAEFVRQEIVAALHPSAVVSGHDHRFGNRGEGDVALLAALLRPQDIKVEVVPEYMLLDAPVRSTRVREHLLLGHVSLAAKLLGRPYSLSGAVVPGFGTGRKLGFPTLNIQVREMEKLVPADGVYAVLAEVDGARLPAVLNIGHRPTFQGEKRSIELHLIDAAPAAPPAILGVHFIDRIRPERPFPSAKDLARQIGEDCQVARRILRPAL